jgi:hypothetical protein
VVSTQSGSLVGVRERVENTDQQVGQNSRGGQTAEADRRGQQSGQERTAERTGEDSRGGQERTAEADRRGQQRRTERTADTTLAMRPQTRHTTIHTTDDT